ncbi:ABC transporter ATP-binding protein [Petrotoga sp. DB-2]
MGIILKKITKTYKEGQIEKHALIDIDLEIEEGSFVAIMGESGSGKTTLLNLIGLIDEVTSGKIIVDSKDVTALNPAKKTEYRKNNIGFIFQDFNLIDSLNVEENIMLPLIMSNYSKNEIYDKVNDVAKRIGIESLINYYPMQISGGEKQRAAIARAVICNPKILLADEPTGALDTKNAKIIMDLFVEINNQGQTILLVTHSPYIASYAKEVVFLKDGSIFSQKRRENKNRNDFYNELLSVILY